jgi:hypothetical protein
MRSHFLRKPTRAGVVRVLALGLVLVLAVLNGGNRALADVDPPGCAGNGANLALSIYRADGVTPISGSDSVGLGEPVNFRATLGYGGANSDGTYKCAFEGGTWTITLPNGQTVPLGTVPRIGKTGTGTGAVPSVTSQLIPYTVSSADEVVSGAYRLINAKSTYSQAYFHDSNSDSASTLFLSAPMSRLVVHATLPLTRLRVQDQLKGLPADATGTVTYAAYTNANCTGTATSLGSTTTIVAGVAALSPQSITISPGQTVYLQATYSGDGKYLGSTSPCNEQVGVGP